MSDDTTKKINDIQNMIETVMSGELPTEELEKLFDIKLSDLIQPGTQDPSELQANLLQQLINMHDEVLQKQNEESLETQEYLLQQFENSKRQGDVAMPLDEELSDDSSYHSKDDSPYLPTKHQDKLNLGVCIMSDDTRKKLTLIQNLFDATPEGEFPTEELEKLLDLKLSDLPGTHDTGQLLAILREQLLNKREEQKNDDGLAKSPNFDLAMAYGAKSLEMQNYLMKKFENYKAESEVAMPLDEKLSNDSSQHSKNSPDSPTKHQDKLNLEVCEEVVESVDSAQISPNVSNDGIQNTATDPIAFKDNSKSYDSSHHKSLTSLSERPNIGSTNASKGDLPNNGTAEGTQPTDVQEPTGSSAVDGDGGGEVAVNEVDHRSTLQTEEGRKHYSAFVKTDYKVFHGVLFCRVCEKNVYSINSDHMKSAMHRQRLSEAFNSRTKRDELRLTGGWQITVNGLLRCYLCRKNYNILTKHCSSEAHTLSKEYKTCPQIQALKHRAEKLWKKLPMTIFDDLLTLRLVNIRGSPEEATSCVACDERFNTHAERERHGRESEEHHSWMDALRRSDPFSYTFGILPKKSREKDRQLRYCMLCKTGMTNSLEFDNHVHGANSQHSKRVRVFWSKVIPRLGESGLANAFPHPVLRKALHTLETPPQKQHYYLRNMLHAIVISTDGYSLCSLCDEYVCDRSMKSHCDSVKHTDMHKLFLSTLRKTNRAGIIRKGNVGYCVFCHVAFLNKTERSVHMNSPEPHFRRAILFHKFYNLFNVI